jgi:hypothetical protein
MPGSVDGMGDQSQLSKLQSRFCIIDISGEIRILDRKQIKKVKKGANDSMINYYKKQDGELLMRRYLESLPISGKSKDAIANFWIDPSTLMYKRTAFTPEPTPASTLNYWSSYTAKPSNGDCRLIEDYLFDVICDRDVGSHTYLLKFLAHMVQKPEEKPGVLIALLGGQGTGKGVFFMLLRAIWARTTLQVSDVDEVVGKFNASLERHYVVCLDESLFVGDRRSLDRLKSMITEPVVRIEQKYQPARSIESKHRFFAASNHEHFVHTEKDDRRFFFLRVSHCRQEDHEYFDKLCIAIQNADTLGGLVDYLENLDLTDFDVRRRPKTTEHSKQKLQSLTKFDRYWYEVLYTGNFTCCDVGLDNWEDSTFVATSALLGHYKEFDKQAGRYKSIQEAHVSEALKKLCPSVRAKRKMESNRQRRGFNLPDIKTARKEFAEYLGCPVEWEDK